MAKFSFVPGALLACFLVGCEGAHLGGRLRLHIPGIVTKTPVPGVYEFRSMTLPFHTSDSLTTTEIISIKATQRRFGEERNTDMLFGPDPLVAGAAVDARVDRDLDFFLEGIGGWVSAAYDNDDAVFAMAIRFFTPWISAQAYGSEGAAQIVNASLQRVYFLDGERMVVKCRLGDRRSTTWSFANSYVDVTLDASGNCNFAPAHVVDATSPAEVHAFLATRAAVKAALP